MWFPFLVAHEDQLVSVIWGLGMVCFWMLVSAPPLVFIMPHSAPCFTFRACLLKGSWVSIFFRQTMAINFKYLVTFDDNNVKIKFLGCASSLQQFMDQLFATAGVEHMAYVPHVFDADFEEYVRLDSFSQVKEGKEKLQMVRSATASTRASAECIPAVQNNVEPSSLLGTPSPVPPDRRESAGVITPPEENVVEIRPLAPIQPNNRPRNHIQGPAVLPVTSSAVILTSNTNRQHRSLQPDLGTIESESVAPASNDNGGIKIWRHPSSAMKEQQPQVNWRSISRPSAEGVTLFGPRDFAHKEMPNAFCDTFFGEISEPQSLHPWQGISPEVLADVEDLGMVFSKQTPPAMLSPEVASQLTDQGYRLVGTHSAVRLSRWTKTQLRGRGACFKRTFYGLNSYETLETSPALSCSSNCVHCWKHPGCPTAPQWTWAADDAKLLVENAIIQHTSLLNTMRDVRGVKPERLKQAQTVRHCDLSLVGEPLMYPNINSYIRHMHYRGISTWMYHTGIHPKELERLTTTTQLVLSVCGPTRQLMNDIVQSVYDDFWERFQASLEIMARKPHRTSLRLIIIKNWTDGQFEDYANIIVRCKPDFIEVKSMIFCGRTLSLASVPSHEDIINFCQCLCAHPAIGKHYELACEHEHSCCALIAHRKFKIDGRWHTWVDVDRFHQLMSQNRPVINAEDYTLPTPNWALYGSTTQGFDPAETRHRRKRRGQTLHGYSVSERDGPVTDSLQPEEV